MKIAIIIIASILELVFFTVLTTGIVSLLHSPAVVWNIAIIEDVNLLYQIMVGLSTMLFLELVKTRIRHK